MAYWIIFSCLIVLACAHQSSEDGECPAGYCEGEGYECINGSCYCTDGYVPNYYQTRCVKCPGIGERCFGICCNPVGNGTTLQCWQGVCQPCHDATGKWICRDSLDQILLVSGTQIIMATSLILGIIATFILLYKLCAATTLRPLGQGTNNNEARLSIGSLQVYVDERLRDAPPRYTRSPQAGSAVYPATVYLNAGFVHDSSLPPPPYTEDMKPETEPPRSNSNNNNNNTVHM
ncbi:uncharacterized protein [Epargyreus clarus]|uniref:uncharacterized protein n=1 Tax=Epargyreus clarus TaxID=520877 RepID=UPI003C2D40F7